MVSRRRHSGRAYERESAYASGIPARDNNPQKLQHSTAAAALEGIAAAGPILSVDHRVHHATKEIPACMAVGQAAGIAAVLALEHGGDAGAVDVATLRRRLVAAGALLDYLDTAS